MHIDVAAVVSVRSGRGRSGGAAS